MNNQEIKTVNEVGVNGNPAGGYAESIGMNIRWQNGPLGRGSERKDPNGTFVETVLRACVDRLRFYQTAKGGQFECVENATAINCIDDALKAMASRTARRESADVEGTHAGN